MMSSNQNTTAARVPAWKRLGLKLKSPGAASEPANGDTPAVGHRSTTQQESHSNKRKLEAPLATDSSVENKKLRRENQADDGNAQTKKTKSVSFGDTPTKNDLTPTAHDNSSKGPKEKKKKSKGPAKKQPPAPTDLKPALEYLNLWKLSRDSWKFNKNHQSTLIKHAFEADDLPAADISTFYEYIRDLKGFVRSRLQETAMEIRTKDMADGASAFPAGTKDLEAKQVSYEKLLTDMLPLQKSRPKRKGFDEVEYVAASQDGDVIVRRLVKRMRAEMILDELSDGEQTDDSRTTQSSNTIASSDTNAAAATGSDKRMRLNDGTGKRRRKLRVNVDDSSSESESESESESDSDTSSDESSSDESDDDDEADAKSAEGDESSSSESSSSSSSSDDSDSDDESD